MERNRRTLVGAIAFAIALLCQSAAFAGDAPATVEARSEDVPFLGGYLRETYVQYPLQLDDWDMQGEHRYDDPQAGVSVRFQRKDDDIGRIDVFFYPLGMLSQEEQARFADAERDALVQTWGESMDDPDDMSKFSTDSVELEDDERVVLRSLDFAYDREGKRYASAMVVAVHRLYAVKLRYTTEEKRASPREVRKTLERFARALFPALEIDSTGACWDPMPVEVLAAGAPEPKDTVLVMKVDDKASTWVLPDRVVIRNASQLDAPIAQILGMAATHRLVDGCMAPRDDVPVAPNGMRLIHLEYKASEEAPSTPVTPMRAARSGLG